MNKTLWDHCLEKGWNGGTRQSDEVFLFKKGFHLYKYRDVCYKLVKNEYLAIIESRNIPFAIYAKAIVAFNLPLDKQINLLNAFIKAYS